MNFSSLRLAAILAVSTSAAAGPAHAAPCPPDALGVSRTIGVNGREGLALGLKTYPRTLDLHDDEVVLTFDDGPAPTTSAVLDALARECVRATFFLIGRNAEAMPSLVRREIAEGHSVGSHSYSHPARTLRMLDETAGRAEIEGGIREVEIAGYGAATTTPHTPFFRFPGFADTPALLGYLAGRGITVFGADLWASDWNAMTPQAELALVMGRLEKSRKGIVLFHDTKQSTAQMMPAFLHALKERGYKIVHIEPGPDPTPSVSAPPGWSSATEAVTARTLGGGMADAGAAHNRR